MYVHINECLISTPCTRSKSFSTGAISTDQGVGIPVVLIEDRKNNDVWQTNG